MPIFEQRCLKATLTSITNVLSPINIATCKAGFEEIKETPQIEHTLYYCLENPLSLY